MKKYFKMATSVSYPIAFMRTYIILFCGFSYQELYATDVVNAHSDESGESEVVSQTREPTNLTESIKTMKQKINNSSAVQRVKEVSALSRHEIQVKLSELKKRNSTISHSKSSESISSSVNSSETLLNKTPPSLPNSKPSPLVDEDSGSTTPGTFAHVRKIEKKQEDRMKQDYLDEKITKQAAARTSPISVPVALLSLKQTSMQPKYKKPETSSQRRVDNYRYGNMSEDESRYKQEIEENTKAQEDEGRWGRR